MRRIFLSVIALLCATGLSARQAAVRNVIYMIGDGMGIAQITAAKIDSGQPLSIFRAQAAGLATTQSANDLVTDSAAAGTALATGNKTVNGSLGVLPSGDPVESIMAAARRHGFATGLVVTVSVTHATPGAFYAHVKKRTQYEDIAAQLVESGIDVAIGGGAKYFTDRKDGRDLVVELADKGYSVARTAEEMAAVDKDSDMVALLAADEMPYVKDGRPADYLADATARALDMLDGRAKKGFMLMVEGSMIDYACHDNDYGRMLGELLDFDRAVGVAMDFADKNPGTLVVVTADHETGGMTLPSSSSNRDTGKYENLKPSFSTGGHTGSMVGVFAYGTGAEEFGRLMDNTDIPKTIARLMKVD